LFLFKKWVTQWAIYTVTCVSRGCGASNILAFIGGIAIHTIGSKVFKKYRMQLLSFI